MGILSAISVLQMSPASGQIPSQKTAYLKKRDGLGQQPAIRCGMGEFRIRKRSAIKSS